MDLGDYNGGYIPAMYVATNCEYIDIYQNNRFVSRCYPNNETYPYLPHPPIIIADFFGNALVEDGYSAKEAQDIKQLATIIASRGGLDKITTADSFQPTSLQQAWTEYGKYVANWGSEAFTYTIKGFYQGQWITKTVGPHQEIHYHIQADTETLVHGTTYDVTRIVIEAQDQHQMRMQYAFDPFEISVTGSVELIGDRLISLQGGQYSVWIRSKNEGIGTVTLRNHRINKTLKFTVQKP